MINFLYGDLGTGKSTYIIEQIVNDCKNKTRSLLIVPEQQTVIKERQLASLLPSSALYCEVTNFSRLSNRIFRELGGLKTNYVTKSGKNLLMYRAICKCRSSLNTYKIDKGHEKSSIKLFLETISEFKSYNVTIDKLENEINALDGNDILKLKLLDLSTIWKTYEELLYESFSDPFDNMVCLAKMIAENDYFKNTNVYIDSFYGYSLAQLDVLKSIVDSASNVTFAFDCPLGATEKTIQFSMIAKNARGVVSLCEGKKTNIIPFNTDYKHKSKDLEIASKYLWDYSQKSLCDSESIILARSNNEFEECEYVAAEISRLIREKDYKYSDIAIIARSASNYIGILDYTLKKYNIPHFLSSPTEWLSRPLLKMIFSALNFADSRRREDLITFAKSQYILTNEGEEEFNSNLADFEKYITSWDIYGDKFYNDDYWNANPDGFVSKFDEKKLERIIKTRDILLKKLRPFSSSDTVSGYAKALFEFLEENKIVSQLENERKSSSRADAYIISQIWDAVLDALDTLVKICKDDTVDISTFSTLLHYAFVDSRVGTIPTGEDNVIIADAHSVRAENIKHVFILGANEGVFPASVSNDSVFSDDEKLLLKSHGIALSETTERRADDELLFFKASLSLASEGAHICALTTGIDGNARQLSSGYKRVDALFKKIKKVNVATINEIEKIYTPEVAKEYFGNASGELRKAILNEIEKNEAEEICDMELSYLDFSNSDQAISQKTINQKYGDLVRFSQSDFSSFKSCKYKFYIDKFLKPQSNDQYHFDSLKSGNLVHDVFEHFVKMQIDNPSGFETLTTEEIKSTVDMLVDTHTNNICKGTFITNKLTHHFNRLKNNMYIFVDKLVKEFSECQFKPARAELKFDIDPQNKYESFAPVPKFDLGNGKTVYLNGKIDRLDTYKKIDKESGTSTMYVRVADYKIGTKEFDVKKMVNDCEVQLPLYLYTITNMQDCKIKDELLDGADKFANAGFFYMPLNIGKLTLKDEISDDTLIMNNVEENLLKSSSKYSGKFLDDEEIKALQDKAPGTYLLPSAKSKSYISEEDFDTLFEDMKKSIIDTSNDIISGKMETNPKSFGGKLVCDTCEHRAICRRRNK